MRVLIIGANGNVGRRIVRRMNDSKDFVPTAFIRKESQKTQFEQMGVESTIADLQDEPAKLSKAINDFDAVVFSAGSGAKTGYDKTMEIDLYGAIKTIHLADNNGIKRYVMVSAAFADQDSVWSDSMRPYYIAKHLADKELMKSKLEYTILRPVGLTDSEDAGKIKIASDPRQLKREIPREAVAQSVLDCLRNERSVGRILEMSEGSEGIAEAISNFTSKD